MVVGHGRAGRFMFFEKRYLLEIQREGVAARRQEKNILSLSGLTEKNKEMKKRMGDVTEQRIEVSCNGPYALPP